MLTGAGSYVYEEYNGKIFSGALACISFSNANTPCKLRHSIHTGINGRQKWRAFAKRIKISSNSAALTTHSLYRIFFYIFV